MEDTQKDQPTVRHGIIFDMDGVIVNTEPLVYRTMQLILERRGHDLRESLFRTFVGRRASDCYSDMKTRFGLPEDAHSLIAENDQMYSEILLRALQTGQLLPNSGLVNLLDRLHEARFLCGLASGSVRWQVDLILDSLDLLSRFASTIAGDEIKHGKPSPDILLTLAERMELEPKNGVVIEDTPLGLQAAQRAGMKSIAYPSPYFPVEAYQAATLQVSHFDEITPALLTSLWG